MPFYKSNMLLFLVFFGQIVLSLSIACANDTTNPESKSRFTVPITKTISNSKSYAGEDSKNSSSGVNIVGISSKNLNLDDSSPELITSARNFKTSMRANLDKSYGGIYGHTNYATTPAAITMYKPAPSYYRPTAATTTRRPISTTSPGMFPTTTTEFPTTTSSTTFTPIVIPSSTFRPIVTPSTTFRPIVTQSTTFRPIVTQSTTFRPIVTPSTTFRPIVTQSTTFRPIITVQPPTSTSIPVIGGDGDDDDDNEEEDTPANSSLAMGERAGRGRSLFGNMKGRPSKINTGATERQNTEKATTPVRQGARAMRLGADPSVVTDFVFSDIKCYKTQKKQYFGASIHMKSGYHVPYIRDRPQDPLTSSECKMERLEAPDLRYRMSATDLRACGVEQCGDSMCLTMVFPRVPTLALADDEVTTIKCLPQKSSISETQSISFSGDNLETRRSSSTVEGGTQDFAAEVGIFRQNSGTSNGLFTQRVNSGGVVQLGEPLQLRSVVRGGDGWTHSKLTDVKVWRMNEGFIQNKLTKLSPTDASEVITLVDANGCRNPEYDAIADSHPLKDPRNNLVHHFTFRAFLFRGQRAAEPLIVTAKVQACQEAGECRLSDCRSQAPLADPGIKRFKRTATEHHNVSSIIQNYDSQMALRVVGLQNHPSSLSDKDFINSRTAAPENSNYNYFSCAQKMAFAAAGGACIMLFFCLVGSSLIIYSINNRRINASQNYTEGHKGEIKAHKNSRGNRIRKRNKPLPPPPADYDQVSTDESLGNHRPSSRINEQKRSFQQCRSGNNPDFPSGIAYECVNETRGNKKLSKSEDGVFIVYCCNQDQKKNGSSNKLISAPASLRGGKKAHSSQNLVERFQPPEDSGDTEESEGYYANEKPRPRTVRDVKRNHHKSRSSKIRRRISSIYRDAYGIRCRGGSFPARISTKSSFYASTRKRGKIYFRDRNDNDDEIYTGGLSQSSDLDSAYCESVCSKHVEDGNCNRNCAARKRERLQDYYDKPGTNCSPFNAKLDPKFDTKSDKKFGTKFDTKLDGKICQKDLQPKFPQDQSPGAASNSLQTALISTPDSVAPAIPPKSQHLSSNKEDSTQIIILPEVINV